jgi:hypothetical protein
MGRQAGRPRQRRAAVPAVNRKIRFYRTVPTVIDGVEQVFSPVDACAAIRGLDFGAGNAYFETDRGWLCAWDVSTAGQPRLSFGVSRRTALPQLEGLGLIRDLEADEHEGVLETSHVVFFPDGIVGMEVNGYGPGIGALSRFFEAKCPALNPAVFYLLVDPEAERKLDSMRELRSVSFKLLRSDRALADQADESVRGMFQAAMEELTPKSFHFVLIADDEHLFSERFVNGIKRLAGSRDVRERAEQFKVKGIDDESGRSIEVDLLSDQVMTTKKVVRQRRQGRAVDPDSMFEQINEAYDELLEQIQHAAALGR